ncbi:MAG: 4Fe-4S single cluster domain-containing protein, partial [Anaerotardibacter sp.]
MQLRMYGTASDSIVDGPGLRFSVFVQGCTHHCLGCHNPESQPHEGGYFQSVESLYEEILANKLVQGVTLSGGEPFEQCAACLELAKLLKEKGYSIWIYSGYLYEDLMAGKPDVLAPELLSYSDVLVDGPF